MATRPFKAIPRPREIGIVLTVQDAISQTSKLSDGTDSFNSFRGHSSISWSAMPSIFRQSDRLINSEHLIVRDLISRFPDHFLNDKTMFDKLVRMQHFGLPTRLLDVTSNPLVALFFLTDDSNDDDGALIVYRVPHERKKYFDSDSVSCICNLANLNFIEKETLRLTSASNISEFRKLLPADRLVQFIREEKPYFKERIKKEDLFRPYYVVPKINNPRISAQSGAFLAFGLNWENETSQKDIKSYMLRVPASAKKFIREQLCQIGIDSSNLFPEINNAAKQIISNYR